MMQLNNNVSYKVSLLWLKNSFTIFRARPSQFIILGILYILINFIPLVGAFFSIILLVQFLRMTDAITQGRDFAILKDLFQNKNIVNLGIVAMFINMISVFLEQYALVDYTHIVDNAGLILIVLLIYLILQLSLWLAPAICLFNAEINFFNAMKISFNASMSNVITIILYQIIVLTITIIAIIPFGLGMIVWLPVWNIAPYFIYKSFFNVDDTF